MFCQKCGTRFEDPDSRFCSRCGAPLAPDEAPGRPTSPLAEPAVERHRRPHTAWPDHPRERIQLPLTELRQRRTGMQPPMHPGGALAAASPSDDPLPPPQPPEPWPAADAPAPPAEEIETVQPSPPEEEAVQTSQSRAEAALRRMVPPKEEWTAENRPGPAERTSVREEWRGAGVGAVVAARPAVPPEPPAPEPGQPPESGDAENPIIPWLEPPVERERPAPPSRIDRPEEGPIIVPRDYDEKGSRQRRVRRRAPRARGPLIDAGAIGRSIKPSWILAIAGVILLTLIVFAIFPPGGTGAADPDRVNRFTGMPVHTVATPARPTAGTPAGTIGTIAATEASPTIDPYATDTPPPPDTTTAETTAQRIPPGIGLLPGATTRPTTIVAPGTGSAGIQVVVSSPGGWSGTIGQQAETYTETPVVGSGTQVREITGPVSMVTVNIQKLDQTTDLLEVRVEQDGAVLKSGQTTEPAGIVALSVKV